MSLLVSGVFGDKVKVLAADNEGSVHFGGNDGSCEDTASDRDFTGERTFFVCGTRVRDTIQRVNVFAQMLADSPYRCMCPQSQS